MRRRNINKAYNFFVSNAISKSGGLSFIYANEGGKRLKFLVDSGASLCLINQSKLPHFANVLPNSQVNLSGVKGKISNKGIVYLNIELGEIRRKQRFCVIEQIECGVDGILGVDFLRGINGVIDFYRECIWVPDTEVCLRMESVNAVCVEIPGRCERLIEVDTYEMDDLVIVPREVCKAVFTAGMIVKARNGRVPVKVMNVNESKVVLTNFMPEYRRTNEYECINFTAPNQSVARVSELLRKIKTNHLNEEERDMITKLVAKYNDIFHLPDDKLTVTNLMKQNIPLKSEAVPSFVKPYRLPHAQKHEMQTQINKMLEDDIIEEAKSEWSSPLLLVLKRADEQGNKKWRLVIDYRLVNKTIQDVNSLYLISPKF